MDQPAITLYEELTMNAHPPLYASYYDGWVLRYACGYTGRSNSVGMLYPSALDPAEKIEACEAFYRQRGLPSMFKVTDGREDVDALLAARGYEILTPTVVMTAPQPLREADAAVLVTEGAPPRWREASASLENRADANHQVADAILNFTEGFTMSALAEENGVPIACGRAVVDRGYVGLYDIVVASGHRNRGWGKRLCAALLEQARRRGAERAYLQVVEDNAPARALYRSLGYTDCYRYWYRREAKR